MHYQNDKLLCFEQQIKVMLDEIIMLIFNAASWKHYPNHCPAM